MDRNLEMLQRETREYCSGLLGETPCHGIISNIDAWFVIVLSYGLGLNVAREISAKDAKGLGTASLKRLRSHVDEFEIRLKFLASRPILDIPGIHMRFPRAVRDGSRYGGAYALPIDPDLDYFEIGSETNDEAKVFSSIWRKISRLAVRSQSCVYSSGIMSFDCDRWIELLQMMRAGINSIERSRNNRKAV